MNEGLTLGKLSCVQMPSLSRRSRISQAKIDGFSPLISAIFATTSNYNPPRASCRQNNDEKTLFTWCSHSRLGTTDRSRFNRARLIEATQDFGYTTVGYYQTTDRRELYDEFCTVSYLVISVRSHTVLRLVEPVRRYDFEWFPVMVVR